MIDLNTENFGIIKNSSIKVVILPWGATEPHNYHLPYLTDSILAESIARKSMEFISDSNQIALLPTVNFGSQNPGQTLYPCCIHYSQETQKGILRDMIKSLIKQKIHKMVIINGHMGNCFKSIIRDLKQDYPDFDIFVINWLEIEKDKQSEIFDNKEDHAGEIETSAMMYFNPELVDLSIAGNGESNGFSIEKLNKPGIWTPRDWTKITSDTGVGNPLASTPEKGEKYVKIVCNYISNFLVDLFVCGGNIYDTGIKRDEKDGNYIPPLGTNPSDIFDLIKMDNLNLIGEINMEMEEDKRELITEEDFKKKLENIETNKNDCADIMQWILCGDITDEDLKPFGYSIAELYNKCIELLSV